MGGERDASSHGPRDQQAHIAYLARHGIIASLSVALVVAGQLRGLLACRRHSGPHHVSRAVRDAAELLGQLISFQLRALEANEQAEHTLSERARSADQAKDVFLANVSHELRTPLNAIAGWASMLQSGAVPSERIPHAIEVIARNARAQSQLVDDLIAASGMSTGQLPLHAQPLDLRTVVHGALPAVALSVRAKLIRQHVQLEEGCWVLGDPCRLQQVTLQLLMNAVKFTPRGGELRVGLTRRAGEVQLSVVDSGRGISSEFLPRLFAPFCQQEEGPARNQQGLGLGLSMVRELVELHGGRVEVDSAGLGKGAQFRVLLPALEPPDAAS